LTGDVEVCVFQGRVDVFNVEEEESGLRGVGFDRFGDELRSFDFVPFFLAQPAFTFFCGIGMGMGVVS